MRKCVEEKNILSAQFLSFFVPHHFRTIFISSKEEIGDEKIFLYVLNAVLPSTVVEEGEKERKKKQVCAPQSILYTNTHPITRIFTLWLPSCMCAFFFAFFISYVSLFWAGKNATFDNCEKKKFFAKKQKIYLDTHLNFLLRTWETPINHISSK